MNWSPPTSDEHTEVLSFFRRLRREDFITAAIFGVIGLIFAGGGIYGAIDGFKFFWGMLIWAVLFLLISIGCAVTHKDKYKRIKAQQYAVSRCRVVSRDRYYSRRHAVHYIRVLCPNGKVSKYKVGGYMYRRAKEDAKAVLVDYSETHKGKRDLSIDLVVISDYED